MAAIRFLLLTTFVLISNALPAEKNLDPPICLNPVVPTNLINIRHFGRTVLSLVLEARTCIEHLPNGVNRNRIYFSKTKCDFNALHQKAQRTDIFHDYKFLGWENPCCTVTIVMRKEGPIHQVFDPEELIFTDVEIVVRVNMKDLHIALWNCSLYPREEYEMEIRDTVINLMFLGNKNDTSVPYLNMPPELAVQDGDRTLKLAITVVVLCLIVVGAFLAKYTLFK